MKKSCEKGDGDFLVIHFARKGKQPDAYETSLAAHGSIFSDY